MDLDFVPTFDSLSSTSWLPNSTFLDHHWWSVSFHLTFWLWILDALFTLHLFQTNLTTRSQNSPTLEHQSRSVYTHVIFTPMICSKTSLLTSSRHPGLFLWGCDHPAGHWALPRSGGGGSPGRFFFRDQMDVATMFICNHLQTPRVARVNLYHFFGTKGEVSWTGHLPPKKKPAPGAMVRTPTQSQSALSRCPAIGPALGPATRRQEMGPWGYPVVQLAIEKCHRNI